jgi:hypothetical protein
MLKSWWVGISKNPNLSYETFNFSTQMFKEIVQIMANSLC